MVGARPKCAVPAGAVLPTPNNGGADFAAGPARSTEYFNSLPLICVMYRHTVQFSASVRASTSGPCLDTNGDHGSIRIERGTRHNALGEIRSLGQLTPVANLVE